MKNGYAPEDARNYTAVGCVEPVSQGKSLASTDAALFNSVNRIDATRCANGVNLNVKFGMETLRGPVGRQAVRSLIRTYFRRGGMQVQLNVIDPAVLIAAREDPRAYPYLLVRVSGYSAYFNDLSPAMKDEIIQRTCALG